MPPFVQGPWRRSSEIAGLVWRMLDHTRQSMAFRHHHLSLHGGHGGGSDCDAGMEPVLEVYSPKRHAAVLPDLVSLLRTCIDQGASMTFHPPLDDDKLARYWQSSLDDPKRVTVLCWDARSPAHARNLLGTVVLHDIGTDTGPFRAKVEKLMVDPCARKLGIGRLLMARLEREGLDRGLYYLTFGTETGCPAEAFYTRIGYSVEGVLPEYIKTPDGRLVGCTHFYKRVTKTNLLDAEVNGHAQGPCTESEKHV